MTAPDETGSADAPVVVTALFAPDDFAWLDGLRRTHFPAERNQLPAHLTLFHALPPSVRAELGRRLAAAAGTARPAAAITGLINLGRGVALRVESPALNGIRTELADAFVGLLSPQDAAGLAASRHHQNKVDPAEARALRAMLERGFPPRPLAIAGLAAWWYRGAHGSSSHGNHSTEPRRRTGGPHHHHRGPRNDIRLGPLPLRRRNCEQQDGEEENGAAV